MTEKTVDASRTEQVQIIGQRDLNGYHRLFGGQLLEWIDTVAAVVARRHSGMNVTTAMIDSLEFRKAAYTNDTVVLSAFITWVGRTSMEICVNTFVESLSGKRELINKAFLILVALDENECPAEVPRLKLVTDEDRSNRDAAERRRALRRTRTEDRE